MQIYLKSVFKNLIVDPGFIVCHSSWIIGVSCLDAIGCSQVPKQPVRKWTLTLKFVHVQDPERAAQMGNIQGEGSTMQNGLNGKRIESKTKECNWTSNTVIEIVEKLNACGSTQDLPRIRCVEPIIPKRKPGIHYPFQYLWDNTNCVNAQT